MRICTFTFDVLIIPDTGVSTSVSHHSLSLIKITARRVVTVLLKKVPRERAVGLYSWNSSKPVRKPGH